MNSFKLFIISLMIGVLLIQNAVAEPLKTFSGIYLYAGVEHPDSASPFCEYSEKNHYWTSNMGGGVNLLKSYDDKFQIDLNYAHHSCVVARDAITYDAWGLQIRYKIDFK